MAGTLTISTLSDGTNSTSATNCIQGSAKAWARFNGGNGNTAGTISASYNVSSITVNGTGDYTANITNALSDANYSVTGCIGTASTARIVFTTLTGSLTTTAVRMQTVQTATGSLENPTTVNMSVFR